MAFGNWKNKFLINYTAMTSTSIRNSKSQKIPNYTLDILLQRARRPEDCCWVLEDNAVERRFGDEQSLPTPA
jgi:hypothetical protein